MLYDWPGFWKYKTQYMSGLEANHGSTKQRDLHYLLSLRLERGVPTKGEMVRDVFLHCSALGWIFRLYLFGKSGAVPLNPQQVKLFAEGSTATKTS